MPGERLDVLEVLRRTERYFAEAGIESARLDAEVLLAHVLGVERIRLYTGHDRPLSAAELSRYRALVRRRAAREPVAYLTGVKEFHSLSLKVTPDVLVPRPETEHLVDLAVELSRGLEEPRLLDIGTGSGCIAVAWAVEVKEGRFTATDVSAAALEVARENAERHGVADRGEFLEGDLHHPVRSRAPFDLVVSNPPYVAPGEVTDPECRREPEAAVFAGEDPARFYERLFRGALEVTAPGGHVLVELPGGREEEIASLLPGGWVLERIVRDYHRLPRVLAARRRPDPAPPSAGQAEPGARS